MHEQEQVALVGLYQETYRAPASDAPEGTSVVFIAV